MTLFSHFSEIISKIDSQIKTQKDFINSAIDIPDWEKAQETIQTTLKNISALKKLKAKTQQLHDEFVETNFFEEEIKNDSQVIENVNQSRTTESKKPDEIDDMVLPKTTSPQDHLTLIVQEESPAAIIDTTENWLNLSEDYQNTKIKAILIEQKKHYVKDMTEALVTVCNWLYNKDNSTFYNMLRAPFVHGKRQLYLSEHPFENATNDRYYKKLTRAEIYIWTNTNSNSKTNLMANMLNYYGLPKNTVQLAIREDYYPDERSYDERIFHPNNEPAPNWSDDILDENTYTKPITHKIGQQKYNQENLFDFLEQETPISIIEFCEDLILKKPYAMALVFTSNKIGKYFNTQKNYALKHFTNPYQLSNGLWMETDGITKTHLQHLKEFCEIK